MKHRLWPVMLFFALAGFFAVKELHVSVASIPAPSSADRPGHTTALSESNHVSVASIPAPSSADRPGHTTALSESNHASVASIPVPASADRPQIKAVFGQVADPEPPTDSTSSGGFIAFVRANLSTIAWALIALLEVITRLTPTDKDNTVLGFISGILDKILPNRRAGGGTIS